MVLDVTKNMFWDFRIYALFYEVCVSGYGICLGTLTENVAMVLIKTLANGDSFISNEMN